jgi:hypothetical protein
MTQADSVLSTPPTNTSPTRRKILGTIAAAAATAVAAKPVAAACIGPIAPDPIFAAIDAFRRAHALFFAEHVDDIPDEIGDQYSAACSVMQRTRPTTPAGLAVLTTWAREQADWLCANSSVLNSEDYCALTASIDDATRGMSGLEPWSPPPLTESAELDAAFTLIAEKRAADVAHDKAIDTYGEFDNRRDRSSDAAIEAQENSAAACHFANEVDWKLATTIPTTLAGVAAVLRFANQIEDEGGEWPDTDAIGPEGWHYQLRATMAAALEALLKAQGAKAVQS